MKELFFILLLSSGLAAIAQQTQVIEYGYNLRGELHMIIQDSDTLMSFYDASGNRITESQNVWSIDDLKDPTGDRFLTCYPNPTGDEVTLSFELPYEMDYQISMYNEIGQFQKQIASEKNTGGKKEIKISLGNQSTGVYFIWFQSREISKVKKVILR
jgi:hypothetical protein